MVQVIVSQEEYVDLKRKEEILECLKEDNCILLKRDIFQHYHIKEINIYTKNDILIKVLKQNLKLREILNNLKNANFLKLLSKRKAIFCDDIYYLDKTLELNEKCEVIIDLIEDLKYLDETKLFFEKIKNIFMKKE